MLPTFFDPTAFLTLSHINTLGVVAFYCLYGGLIIITLRLLRAVLSTFKAAVAQNTGAKYGEWAVVTGATDGIGKAMAMLLAKRGYKMLLISRSANRLKDTEKELRSALGNRETPAIQSLAIDFSKSFDLQELETSIGSLDIGILVNNVGASYPHPMYFEEVDASFIDMLINVNLRSALQMTSIVYKGMAKRKRGAIVCIGSGASQLPSSPLLSLYAGVKGGIESFCRSLNVEAAQKNVIIQCQVPLLIASKLSKIHRSSLTVPSASKYAKHALRAVDNAYPGFGSSTVCPYWPHQFQLLMLSVSRTMSSLLMKNINEKLRAKAVRKATVPTQK